MRKIGVLGGTFDPVHVGHIQLARAAIREASLDKVLMIPAAGPPHKEYSEITPFHHRLAMLRLAVAGESGIEISAIEGELPKPSYTVDTIRLLRKRAEIETLFHFIIGIDAFVDILSWKSYHELLGLAALLVARRKGFEDELRLRRVMEILGYSEAGHIWRSGDSGMNDILFLHADIHELSSTSLRMMLAHRQQVPPGLPEDVREYILENHLYTGKSG